MPSAHIVRASQIVASPRVLQLQGMFDVPPSERSELTWDVALPLDERPWSIGLIVGPSGCGKSTIARELFGDHVVGGHEWPEDRSLLDAFPEGISIKEIALLLSSVGFSSPPSWLRPFRVLSNGEQFRASIARTLAENPELSVIDEFTSVVDRTVAQIGSAAVAKTVRRRGARFIAVSCHYDIQDWLDPDWVYEPAVNKFSWRSLQGRPPISLTIARVPASSWAMFKKHHYLSADLHRTATCFVAFLGDRPAAFHAYLNFVGKLVDARPAMRVHRSVCLPDFQGVGIGNAVSDYLASMWAGLGYRVFLNSGHPAVIAGAIRSRDWLCVTAPKHRPGDGGKFAARRKSSRSVLRFTASFEYRGASMARCDALKLLGRA